MNQVAPDIFLIIYKTIFLENNRDRLAMACSMGDRHRGLGGDTVASHWAATLLERQQEEKEPRLARKRLGTKLPGMSIEDVRL